MATGTNRYCFQISVHYALKFQRDALHVLTGNQLSRLLRPARNIYEDVPSKYAITSSVFGVNDHFCRLNLFSLSKVQPSWVVSSETSEKSLK